MQASAGLVLAPPSDGTVAAATTRNGDSARRINKQWLNPVTGVELQLLFIIINELFAA